MAPKTKAEARASLKTKFKKKYNIDYGSTLGVWDNYKKANFVYITDKTGESYWFDNRTKQRVTPAYERKIYNEVKGSNQAITNFNRIDLLGGIARGFDWLDKGGELGKARERATFFPEAKQGDQPFKGDKPHYTYNDQGELVVTGGIKQHQKNQRLKKAEAEFDKVNERINQVVPNKYRNALKIMGIEPEPEPVPVQTSVASQQSPGDNKKSISVSGDPRDQKVQMGLGPDSWPGPGESPSTGIPTKSASELNLAGIERYSRDSPNNLDLHNITDASQKNVSLNPPPISEVAKRAQAIAEKPSAIQRRLIAGGWNPAELAKKQIAHAKWVADRAAGKLKTRKFDPRLGKNQRRSLVPKKKLTIQG